MYCPNCGKENKDSAVFCVECGTQLQRNLPNNTTVDKKLNVSPFTGRRGNNRNKIYADNKNPVLALILSLIIVGLGQFYNGDTRKGALMLGGAVLGGSLSASILWWIMSIWSAYDAYKVASKSIPLWK